MVSTRKQPKEEAAPEAAAKTPPLAEPPSSKKSSTRGSGKRPVEDPPISPEPIPQAVVPIAHPIMSVSPFAGSPSHGVIYTPQLYDGGIAGSSSTPIYDTVHIPQAAAVVPTVPDLVRLMVSGLPGALPRIGELEAAFLAGGRVRKVWRIELRQDRALVDVERYEVAQCVGATVAMANLQVVPARPAATATPTLPAASVEPTPPRPPPGSCRWRWPMSSR